jgi:hypothetical protein
MTVATCKAQSWLKRAEAVAWSVPLFKGILWRVLRAGQAKPKTWGGFHTQC